MTELSLDQLMKPGVFIVLAFVLAIVVGCVSKGKIEDAKGTVEGINQNRAEAMDKLEKVNDRAERIARTFYGTKEVDGEVKLDTGASKSGDGVQDTIFRRWSEFTATERNKLARANELMDEARMSYLELREKVTEYNQKSEKRIEDVKGLMEKAVQISEATQKASEIILSVGVKTLGSGG